MLALAWANLTHHKLRAGLSALAVGLGLALFLVSKGLASGSIGEVAQRMQSVDAQLLVLPAQENTIFTGGAPFPGVFERLLAELADDRGPLAEDVIPVFWQQVRMGGQQQRLFGVRPEQMSLFLGQRRLLDGDLFRDARRLDARLAELRAASGTRNVSDLLTPDEVALGCELIIDDRLRQVGQDGRPYELGDTVQIMGREFRIAGVVEAGVAGRVFAPIETMRHMLNAGEPWSSMFFIKLRPDVDHLVAEQRVAAELGSQVQVRQTSDYGRQLRADFAQLDMYMTASSGLALVVCFLFILLTMYTFVLERTREIGILKALGVTRSGLVLLSVAEALLISGAGVVIGVALAGVAKGFFALRMPLLTLEISPERIGVAVLIGLIGGTCSALYPGWRAARLQPAVALSHE